MIDRVCSLIKMQPPLRNRGLLFVSGTTVPTDATDGYQTGCIFQKTDGGIGTSLYVNDGSVTSCAFNAIEALESITLGDLEDVADAYTSRLLETGTYQSTASGGVTLSSSNNRPFSLLYDDAGVALSNAGVVRGMLSRILLTVDCTGSTITPVRGQLKMLGGIDVAAGIYAPVQGYIEVAGTSIASSGATLSCLSASLEITTALTAASGGEVAGLHVETTGAGTLTATGTVAGILIDKASGAADWPVGISVLNSTTAINIGACTTGVNFSGICTKNITMGTTGGSGSTTALGTLSSSWYGVEISVSANLAANEAHAIRAEIETTAGTAGNMMVARFDACASHSVNTLNGINATAQLLGNATLGGRVAAGYISLYGAGSKTLTRTDNSIYGLFVQHLLYSDPGDAPGSGDPEPGDNYNAAIGVSMPGATYCDYGLVLKGETSNLTAALLIAPIGTSVWPYGILFSEGTPSSGATPSVTTALHFDSSCNYTNFAGWEAASGAISVVTADVSGTSTTHALRIDIAGVAHYIPVYNTTSW